MKRLKLNLLPVFALLITYTCCYGDIVPWNFTYTGQLDSFFKRSEVIYSLHGTTTSGSVNAYSFQYPYVGGMVISNPQKISPTDHGIATLFKIPRSPAIAPDCWSNGYIDGTITIGETSQYPMGTPVLLKIDYMTENLMKPSDFYLDRGAALITESFDILWIATHYTHEIVETYEYPAYTGSTYYFYVWQTFGTEDNPIHNDAYRSSDTYIGSAVSVDFHIIPEPATLLLLALGGVMIRRKK